MLDKSRKKLRCAIYTRKSSEEGLEQDFNSLDAQREACEAYIASQRHEGWMCIRERYDDGAISGATLDRPALQRLLADVKGRKIDAVVVYKVDRLTRALADFAKIVETFDAEKVSFVSVTQQFNTTTSMGRLTLNVLLSFAQFEREVTAERIRDKIAASKKKGMWMGGRVPLGYDAKDRSLAVNEGEAETVRTLFRLYLEKGSVREVTEEANRIGLRTKLREDLKSRMRGGRPFFRGHIYRILSNPVYIGRIQHKTATYPGLHPAIIDQATWDAVQEGIHSNRVNRRNGTNAKNPSPLASLLFNDKGTPFTPTHAVKKGRRYRYYVERDATQTPKPLGAPRYRRIPAAEIETLVTDALRKLLRTPNELIEAAAIGNPDAVTTRKIVEAGSNLAVRLRSNGAQEQYALMQSLVRRVTLGDSSLEIRVARHDLNGLLGIHPTADKTERDDYRITIPARLRPRGIELKFVILDPAFRKDPKPDNTLIRGVVRANAWLDELMDGKVKTLREIAERETLPERYVRRVLELTFLAPDITQAILDGGQPETLTLEDLVMGGNLPPDWARQRKRLGFIAP